MYRSGTGQQIAANDPNNKTSKQEITTKGLGVHIKGPADGDVITAAFNSDQLNGQPLKNQAALVLISIIDNPFCSEDYFRSIAQHAYSIFKEVVFLIVDDLQVYNLKSKNPNISAEEAQKEITLLRNQWWKNNEAAFLSLLGQSKTNAQALSSEDMDAEKRIDAINKLNTQNTKPFQIYTWKMWLRLPLTLNVAEGQFEKDSEVLEATDRAAKTHVGKRYKESDSQYAIYLENSKKYLVKETYNILSRGAHFKYILYPGAEPATFTVGRKKLSVETNLLWVPINFKKAYSSQSVFGRANFFTPPPGRPLSPLSGQIAVTIGSLIQPIVNSNDISVDDKALLLKAITETVLKRFPLVNVERKDIVEDQDNKNQLK